ncbi:MAG: dihydroneopterin aldolase [Bacteroidota bacterium]
MLTVSLHGIKLYAPHGLYPQEHILGNSFEVDVDISLPDAQPWPFADYTLIQATVANIFNQPGQLLETFVYNIHIALREGFPASEKIKVTVRKLHPPMPGDVAYAQVCYETPNP